MRVMEVLGVRVEMPTNQPIVLLKERDGDRCLPVWIGAAEASAIAYAQQGVTAPRPLTHDLLLNVVSSLHHRLVRVRIAELRDQVFHAVLEFEREGALVEVDARTSDAIALALRCGAPVLAPDAMLDQVGVVLPAEDDDEEVEKFREFLDQITPEDFGADPPS